MKTKILLSWLAGAVLMLGSARNLAANEYGKDIVDTAVAAGSFNTLAKALQAAGLVECLAIGVIHRYETVTGYDQQFTAVFDDVNGIRDHLAPNDIHGTRTMDSKMK